MVSALSIFFIIFNMIFALALPTVMAIVIKKRYKGSLAVFFIGCAVWFLFAIVLEQMMHIVVLTVLPVGKVIQNNIWLYGIYGGLAAGVFEETGRFLAMKFTMKKHYGNPYNAIMYGAGHGGFEAFFILGTGMLNSLIYAILINTNQTQLLLGPLDETQRASVQAVLNNLIETPSHMLLLGDVERISAVILHIALSVLVWAAVVKGKKLWYLLAIFIHFLVDASIVIINSYGFSVWGLELIIFGMSIAVAAIAGKVWKTFNTKE